MAVALLAIWLAGCARTAKEPVDYVAPNIGGIGYLLAPTFPNVQLPHGMARLVPITTPGVKDRYLDDRVQGFRAAASILMPFTGEFKASQAQWASLYDHDLETATPYYYSNLLETYNVQVEYTVTHSVAYYRFTFPQGGDPHVLFS